MIYIVSILVTAILFLLLILLLAVKPEISKKITVGALAIAGGTGLLIYGYGYMVITKNFALAVLKALLAVCGSFVGRNEYANLSSIPFMNTIGMQILCTAVQVCALYATASAVITSIGAEALKRLRLWAARRRQLHLIYGVNEDTLAFGKDLIAKKQGAVVYVDNQPSASMATAIAQAGCVLRTDARAVSADRKFLRSIGGAGKGRDITLYTLSKNNSDNLQYARKMLTTLESLAVAPERLRIVILGQEEPAISQLQAEPGRYGYGFVTVVNEPGVVSRLLMIKYPPCNTVPFDENGKACEDFEALLIGFGQVGQAVLKALVMNGQFEGSRFKVTVFAPDFQNTDGCFANQLSEVFQKYDITFCERDARSRQMYEYLRERGRKLKYVAVCTGNVKRNEEIAEELTAYFNRAQIAVPVYQCSRSGVETYHLDGTATAHKIYCSELLCSNALDDMAMVLNHRYQAASEKTALENWMECDYFSRQSCRASADFVPAMLRAAGKTARQAAAGDWDLTQAQLETLSKTEHLRWCAFHYCMGFSAMQDAEFQDRAKEYLQQKETEGKPTIRIGKNMQDRTHACLVDWEELDALSEKEAAVTGKYVDYKAMDKENVLAIPELLQFS